MDDLRGKRLRIVCFKPPKRSKNKFKQIEHTPESTNKSDNKSAVSEKTLAKPKPAKKVSEKTVSKPKPAKKAGTAQTAAKKKPAKKWKKNESTGFEKNKVVSAAAMFEALQREPEPEVIFLLTSERRLKDL